jgi:hypothetical protein
MYKEVMRDSPYGVSEKFIVRDNGNGNFTSFPAAEDNTNYQTYLAWLAEGNEPLPAEE